MKFVNQVKKELKLDYTIEAVLADRNCGAVEYARKIGLETFVFERWNEQKDDIVSVLRKINPDVVVTNIHKILVKEILESSPAKFINVHYSLLPSFGGVVGFKTLEMAKKINSQIIGATCHYVSEKVDSGEILSQAAIAVDWSKDIYIIGDKVFRIACESLLNGLMIIAEKKVDYYTCSEVLYSPKLLFDNTKLNDSFWKGIRES